MKPPVPMIRSPQHRTIDMGPVAAIPTHIAVHDGLQYVMVHTSQILLTTIGVTGAIGADGQIALMTLDPRDGELGLGLIATLSIDAAEQIGNSLKRAAAAARASANDAATAVLRKAAGK